jgi:hypothetical protein
MKAVRFHPVVGSLARGAVASALDRPVIEGEKEKELCARLGGVDLIWKQVRTEGRCKMPMPTGVHNCSEGTEDEGADGFGTETIARSPA